MEISIAHETSGSSQLVKCTQFNQAIRGDQGCSMPDNFSEFLSATANATYEWKREAIYLLLPVGHVEMPPKMTKFIWTSCIKWQLLQHWMHCVKKKKKTVSNMCSRNELHTKIKTEKHGQLQPPKIIQSQRSRKINRVTPQGQWCTLRAADFIVTVGREERGGWRSLICTQSSALRTFVHNNNSENHYWGQVTKLQVYENTRCLQCKSHRGIGIYTI